MDRETLYDTYCRKKVGQSRRLGGHDLEYVSNVFEIKHLSYI